MEGRVEAHREAVGPQPGQDFFGKKDVIHRASQHLVMFLKPLSLRISMMWFRRAFEGPDRSSATLGGADPYETSGRTSAEPMAAVSFIHGKREVSSIVPG